MLTIMPSLLDGLYFISRSEDRSKRRDQQPENRHNSPKCVKILFLITLLLTALRWWWFKTKIALAARVNWWEAPVTDVYAQEACCEQRVLFVEVEELGGDCENDENRVEDVGKVGTLWLHTLRLHARVLPSYNEIAVDIHPYCC